MTVLGASLGLNGMKRLPAGEFAMGSEDFYPEEAPVRRVEVEGFWIDARPVTVGQFRRFVKQTGYVSVAERPLDPALYPDADRPCSCPGSRVPSDALAGRPVRRPELVVVHRPARRWERPEGPGSDTYTRGRHPVTQVAYEDAAAYAAWAGKALPTEAEWEYAARGGLDGKAFAWGDELAPGGQMLANSWQGEFPWQNLMLDGYSGTSPVGAFPPNGYGLYDMTGNVWEWTCDPFTASHGAAPAADRLSTTASRAGSSRAAPTCARRTTACASGPPRDRAKRSTPRPATSASAASSAALDEVSDRCSRPGHDSSGMDESERYE